MSEILKFECPHCGYVINIWGCYRNFFPLDCPMCDQEVLNQNAKKGVNDALECPCGQVDRKEDDG